MRVPIFLPWRFWTSQLGKPSPQARSHPTSPQNHVDILFFLCRTIMHICSHRVSIDNLVQRAWLAEQIFNFASNLYGRILLSHHYSLSNRKHDRNPIVPFSIEQKGKRTFSLLGFGFRSIRDGSTGSELVWCASMQVTIILDRHFSVQPLI